jgi:hypothetical protein
MGGHQKARMHNDEWLTPPDLLAALGAFDLDPCAPMTRPWDMAARHLTLAENGLLQPWAGRVYCNPPYGRSVGQWLARMAEHANGVAMVFARTETEAWQVEVWPRASAVLFIAGRLHFYRVDGTRAPHNCGAPTALIAYGRDNVEMLESSGVDGYLVRLR